MNKTCKTCNIEMSYTLFREGRNSCKICVYNKTKCQHNINKNRCRPCNGSQICEHDKLKNICRDCSGTSFCEHSIRKSRCKDCRGSSICEHNKIRSFCIECGGSSICKHSKQKSQCRECGGGSICEHNKIRSQCRECGGGSICEHDKLRSQCRECGGGSICEHDKLRRQCIICNPNCSCVECKGFQVTKKSQFYPLCQACFCNKYPDHEKSNFYKIKERYLRDELRLRFPDKDINMVFDKTVDGGCSKKRPDVFIDLLLYSIIIECDEDQHKNYECENKRIMQLFEDLGERPLIIIRFNPDSYMENKKKIEGCFKPLIKIEDIHKKKFYELNEEEWKRRVDILEEVIREKIREDIPEKEVEEIKLFYDVV